MRARRRRNSWRATSTTGGLCVPSSSASARHPSRLVIKPTARIAGRQPSSRTAASSGDRSANPGRGEYPLGTGMRTAPGSECAHAGGEPRAAWFLGLAPAPGHLRTTDAAQLARTEVDRWLRDRLQQGFDGLNGPSMITEIAPAAAGPYDCGLRRQAVTIRGNEQSAGERQIEVNHW